MQDGVAKQLSQVYDNCAKCDEKVTDPKTMYTLSDELIIKKGKKVFHKVTMA